MPYEATVVALRLWADTSGAAFPPGSSLDNEVRRMRARLSTPSACTSARFLMKYFVYGMELAIKDLAAGICNICLFKKAEMYNLGERAYMTPSAWPLGRCGW